MEDESAIHGRLGMVVLRIMGMFYSDEGLIVSRYPEWLQGGINSLIGIFQMVRLMGNVEKSKTMTFHTGEIHTSM